MNILVVGDSHIQENSLDELDNVFSEILTHTDKNNDIIVQLGDFFHKNRPTAKELKFGTYWAKEFFQNSLNFYMLRGNHPMINYKDDDNSVEYLKYLGINIVEDLVIDNIYFGHKMTEKSYMFFAINLPSHDRYLVNTKDLKQYKNSFLGHQHQRQQINNKDCHLGSIIYTTFAEIGVDKKYIAKYKKGKIDFYEIKNAIPMKEVFNINELDDIDRNTKVRLTFKNFDDFKNGINYIQKYKSRFVQFKIKCDFDNITITPKGRNIKLSLKDIFNKWIKSISDMDVRRVLENEIVHLRISEKESL